MVKVLCVELANQLDKELRDVMHKVGREGWGARSILVRELIISWIKENEGVK